VTRVLGLGYLGEGKTMGLAAYRVLMQDAALPDDIRDAMASAVSAGSLPFNVHRDASYDELTEAWIAFLHRHGNAIQRTVAELNADTVAVSLAAGAQRTVEEALRALHAETISTTRIYGGLLSRRRGSQLRCEWTTP